MDKKKDVKDRWLCDETTDLEMQRRSCITWVDVKRNQVHPFGREAEGYPTRMDEKASCRRRRRRRAVRRPGPRTAGRLREELGAAGAAGVSRQRQSEPGSANVCPEMLISDLQPSEL